MYNVFTDVHTIPHDKLIKHLKLKCFEPVSIQPLYYGKPNKFRSTHVLNKSHNKLHGLIMCAIIVVNMIFE